MSEKSMCPACASYTSEIHRAFESGYNCPRCGLPAEAALQVESARARGADQELVDRAVQADLRAEKVEKQNRRLRNALTEVQNAVHGLEL